MSDQGMIDQKYIRLSQFYKIISNESDVTETIVKNILQNASEINYRIPANDYLTLNKPHLIGCTALQFALESNKIQIFQWLLKYGADFMTQNSNNESLLHLAFKKFKKPNKYWAVENQSNQYSFIDLLLSAQINIKNSTNLCNKDGLTHFHIACMRNNVEAVEFFLQNGVDINQTVNQNSSVSPGFTALHFAAKYSALETAELLIKYSADVNLKDNNGMSPLHLIIAENMDITSANYRVDSDGYKKQKDFIENNLKIINLLTTHIFGNDLSLVDSIGLSHLHILSTFQNISMIEKGIGLQSGYTALHFAAHCSFETLIFLLNKGADILAKDAKGVSPFDICLKKYRTKDLHSIIITQPAWKDIIFSDWKTKLSDLLELMQNEEKFLDFLDDDSLNANVCIPRNSTLWPGYTILHLAVLLNGKFEKQIDYEQGDNSDDPDYNPEEYGMKTIKMCIRRGGNVSTPDIYGTTPLHLAFRMRRKVLTELLLRDCPTKTNPIDEFGLSHLHIACASGFQTLAKIFMDRVCGRKNINGAIVKSNFRWYQEDTCESSNCWMSRFLIVGSTPLHTVVSQGNMSLIRLLIRRGANIYAKDYNGITPVHQSLSANFSETHILKEFFMTQDLKDSVANCGLSHLHIACYVNNINVVRKLLDEGADIEGIIRYEQPADCHFKYNKIVQGNEFAMDDPRHRQRCGACDNSFNSLCYLSFYAGCTPLMLAMKKNNQSVILLLVERGANYLAKTPNGSVLLYDIIDYHARTGDCSWVPVILRHPPVQQVIKADIGLTQLHIACILLDAASVQQLLAKGFDPNVKLNENSSIWPGYTPLHFMLVPRPSDRIDTVVVIIRMLLSAGVDVTIMNARKETPIHFAYNQITASKKNPAAPGTISVPTIIELLLKCHTNFNIDVFNSRGISHFHVACVKNDVKIAQNFLHHGVDVNRPVDYFDDDYGGFTALHLACSHQCKETVDLLLQYGANVFAKDSAGNTALQIVAQTWNQDIFDNLIMAGADINAKNLLLETPFETLLKSNKVTADAITVFLNYRCNVNLFNPVSHKGLIGLACQSHSKVESIEHEPIYNAIMSAPNIHELDDMGRTPIHNLVSVNEKGGSTRDFVSPIAAVSENIVYNMKVIDGFTRLGHDIDHQDARGWTALHAAVPFDNRVGIMALLSNGADFNITDANGDTPYMSSFEQSKSKSRRESQALELLSMHVRKLERFGLYISKENKDLDKIICQQRTYYSHNKLNIEDEVEEARKSYFGLHPVTLYDFLSETGAIAAFPTMPKLQSQIINQVFQDNRDYLRATFPGLVGIFHLQYRKALARGDLIKSATGYLNSLARVELPTLCLDIIFKYLANDDLKIFIQSDVQGIHSSKRKRTD